MRKTFLYYNRLALFLTVVFSLFSCNSFVNDIEENKSDNVSVTFAITGYESSERTIIPSTADTQTLYFKLEGKEVATGKEAVLINCKKYEDFSSITLKLNAGDWDFKITGYLDEEGTKAVITGSKNNVNIKPGENNIVFDMKPDVTQKGSIKITLKYDLGTDTQSEISEVSVKRTDTSFASLFETKWEKGNPSDYIVVSDITDGKGYITFTETNVASGSYFLAFEVKTKNGTETGLGYRRDLVIVTGSCESAAELELKVTQAYKITYENEDKSDISGCWKSGYEPPLYYTSYKSVALPTSDNLEKTGFNFVGWFTKDGASIDKTKIGATGATTFYARWQNNSLFVSKNGNNSNDGSQAHPFATVAKALSIPNNENQDWTVWVMDDIKEDVQIEATLNSKAKSITISGLDSNSSITANSTSAITVNSTKPIYISNITIKGGNGTSVESTTGGGCLFVNTADVNVTVGTNAILRDGKAKSGAAVYVNNGKVILDKTGGDATDGGSIESNNSGNISGVKGGGVYVASSGILEIKSGTIKNNFADAGGGIYNAGGTVTMTGGTIYDNKAGATSNGNGGGVFNASGTFSFADGSITDNKAGSSSANNKNSKGGGIYNVGTLEISGGTIGKDGTNIPREGADIPPSDYSNYSNNFGAGIYNEENAQMTFTGTTYKVWGNYAKGQGGGIYNNNIGSPWSNDCVISNAANMNPNNFYKE